ncbi:MAG TPA: T9SS type A sorting domain-containing protein, partial [Chitinophagaceae bacterium]|nr:T9SS type A sorting domain-containing protein [Chitinophagaceae bacterium]
PRCRYAFMLVPGTGTNESYSIVNGWGYHNQLCQMVANCRTYGDVYTFMKPNEESRAIFWNGKKLNEYIVSYLITQNTRYGINYLIEMIAWIKYLKANYDKVFLFGLSEGGYSSLLCTMYIQPDAALISGGYSIKFDSNAIEKPILKTRFDDLLDTFHQAKVRDVISQSSTQYLFTYGEGDPVETMDPEHDYHYTQTYFSGLNNTSFFYDFNDHTFPPCANIDTFIDRILLPPLAHFVVTDSSLTDTLITKVSFCRTGIYSFDLYRDTNFVQHFSAVMDSTILYLSDSGSYTLRNIVDTSALAGTCRDTIYCTKQFVATPDQVHSFFVLGTTVTNPFHNRLILTLNTNVNETMQIQVFNLIGEMKYTINCDQSTLNIDTQDWPAGMYILRIRQGENQQQLKLLKTAN